MARVILIIAGALLLTITVFYVLLKNAGACTGLEEAAKSAISAANYCQHDSDCRSISFGCPFGCESLVNREKMSQLRATISSYHETCLMICPDDCPPVQSPLACVNGSCVRL